MLASYIITNLSSEKDDQSKFEGKRMVSLLDAQTVPSKTTLNSQSGKKIAVQNQTPSQTKQGGTNSETSQVNADKNVTPSSKTQEKTANQVQQQENVENPNVEGTPKTPVTIVSIDKTIELTKCTDTTCKCSAIHCPFCTPSHFKPSIPSRVRDHLEYKHFSHAVQYEDLVIVKCYQNCFGKKEGHYHCPICKEATFLKRIGFTKHLVSHAQKESKDPSIVSVPDNKHPSTVSINDYEIDICKQNCLVDDSSDPHYHCPLCESMHLDRKSLILHVWRCETTLKDVKDVKTPKIPAVNKEGLDKAYNVQSDLPPVEENEDIISHFSIIRNLSDLPNKKCQEDKCCGGKHHCVLCTRDRFKPCYSRKLQMHHFCHWGRRVQFKGYFVLPCYSDCEMKEGSVVKPRFHFHCPTCGGTRRRRECFSHHIKICRGKGKSFARIPDLNGTQEFGLGGVKLEAIDFMEDELNDAMPDSLDNEDEMNDLEDSFNEVAEMDLSDHMNDADQDEMEQEVDLQHLKLFSSVTADISKQLLKVIENRGLDTIFSEVSDQTGVSYLVSPGITSPVHSLHGDMKALSKATLIIQQKLGIEDHEKAEKSTNTEKTEDQEGVEEPEMDVDETPAKSKGKKRGRKKSSVNEKSSQAKKIKVEPLDHAYESPQGTPGRRYSTRGVRVDFSLLLAGKNREEATLERDTRAVDSEDNESDVEENKKTRKSKRSGTVTSKENMDKKASKSASKDTKGLSSKDRNSVSSKSTKKRDKIDENEDEAYDEMEYNDESRDDQDYSVVNDKSIDYSGAGVTSSSMNYFMQRYNLSNTAVIPKVSLESITPRKNRKEYSFVGRRCYSVVNKYRCTKCEFTCDNFKECSDHLTTAHETNPELRCDVCERHFDKLHHLRLHLETKHGPQLETKQHICPHCKKEYVSLYALELHVDSKHKNPERPKFACRKCNFIGEDRHDLETHVQANHYHLHTGELCTICGKTFKSKTFLEQHVKNIHVEGEEYKCTVCDKSFPRRRNLLNHMSIHAALKEHTCPTCGKKFRKKGNMRSHMETHKRAEDRTYKYCCKYCGTKINSKSNYLEHLNKHTGNRPFLCEICGKSFAYRTAVYKHKMFIHSSETPYKCNTCGKKFKAKHLLNQHIIIHTGISTFKCDSCEKMFTTATSLKIHKPKCKAVPIMQHIGGNLVIFTTPNNSQSQVVVSGGESILPNKQMIDNLNLTLDNPVTTTATTEVQESTIVFEAQVDNVELKTDPEAQAPEGSEVALYLCSECNAAFHDFAQAEQHVLMGHEPAVPQPTNSLNEAVNVILKDMPENT